VGALGKNGEASEKNWKALENICMGIEKNKDGGLDFLS